MENTTSTRPALHPIIWVAAVAVIAASAVGIAAMTGLIPGHEKAADPAATAQVVPPPAAVVPLPWATRLMLFPRGMTSPFTSIRPDDRIWRFLTHWQPPKRHAHSFRLK